MAVTEVQARAVLLLQSLESLPDSPTWSADDRRWATRAAAQGLPDDATREALIVERARLAAQRLAGRDAGLRQWLAARTWRATWAALAVGLGGLLGGVSDALVAGPYFNLLSPLFWGLLAWNGAVYAGIALQVLMAGARGSTGGGRLQRLVARWLPLRVPGVGPRVAADWASASGPLWLARASALLHGLAAGLALGLVAGLLLRGLVLDYRAGWATTLLAPETVRAALALGLQPAWWLTGLAPPDAAAAFEALRVVAGQPARASAAPWIVLMATQLMAWVVLPRLALAAWAGWRARRLAADFPLALEGAAFDRWLPVRATGGAAAEVWVLPHGRAPEAAATAALRTLVEGAWGAAARLTLADALPWGDEDHPPTPPAGARALLLVDLATTPEAEVHGRLLQALGAAWPLVLADEHAFVQRFGRAERLDQRRQAWRTLLGERPFVGVDLGAADLAPSIHAVQAALSGQPGARGTAPGQA